MVAPSVDDLMQDKAETGNGEHVQESESGIVRERRAYINRERIERDAARQQGGAAAMARLLSSLSGGPDAEERQSWNESRRPPLH